MLKPIITPLTVILILSLFLGSSCSRQIVDFEYAEYTHAQEQSLNQRQDFNFQPAPIPESQLKFPQVCSLIDELVDAQKEQAGKFSSTDIDAYLNKMKAKFLSLLTLTQQLQNSESKILHFEHLINQTHPLAPQESDIIQIQGYEQRLHSLSEEITRLDQLLKSNLSLIEDASVNYYLSEAKKIQLDFKIDWLKQKKNYLHSFQIRSKQARSRQGADVNYTDFFDELQAQFTRQTSQIQTIDEIIEKKSTLILLRQEKSQIQSSITALELYIQDIHECIREKQNIRQQFKNHDKINELINELKELKKNEAGPNPYCEGVATKLTEKIRTMVRYYGIVASCSSDEEQKVKELNDAKQRLNEIMTKIQELESVEDMAEFRVKYNAQKQVIDNVFLKIKDWKIKQFVHDPQQIQALRLQTQQQLQKLTRQRAPPCIPEGTPRSAISQQVVDLIKQIRQLKYQYCDLYAKYDSLSNTLWSETYRYESEVKLKNKLIEMYNSERRLYKYNHQKLIKLRNEIVELLS